MNEVEDVQPGHIYQPGNKKEVRLVYRILSGPYCGRHQKSFSLTKWGPAGAWAAAREAKAFMLDTGRLPPFFASPYSRSRLTNASANGLSRGFPGEGGVNGSSDSDDLSSPPTTTLADTAATASACAAGPKRSQRRSRASGASLSSPSTAAGAATTAMSPDLGSAASTVEALLSLKNSRQSLLVPVAREADLFPDAASLQLLALGAPQQQQATTAGNPVAGRPAAACLASRPQTALNLAALSVLSAGYPLYAEDQQQQQCPAKSSALLLQQMENLDSSAALLKLLDQAAGSAVNINQQLQQGVAARGTQRPGTQQVQWDPEVVDAQLLGMTLKPLLARESPETTQGASPGPLLQGTSHDTTSPLGSLDGASMELNSFGIEQTAATDAAPLRDALDTFSLREVANGSLPESLQKERDMLLDFLATTDHAQRQLQQQQQRQQPQEDMLGALNSLVTLLESVRSQDPAKQFLAGRSELLNALATPQGAAELQQQQQPLAAEPSGNALQQQQAASSPYPGEAEAWRAAYPLANGTAVLNEKDHVFSASLLRFLQGQQGCDEVAEASAVAPAAERATSTPGPHGTGEMQEGEAPFHPTSKTSRSTSTSSCVGNSNTKTEGAPVNAATVAKASRRSSDACCPSSESIGVSPPPDLASTPEVFAEQEGRAVDEQHNRGEPADVAADSADFSMRHANASAAAQVEITGSNSGPAAFASGLVGSGSS